MGCFRKLWLAVGLFTFALAVSAEATEPDTARSIQATLQSRYPQMTIKDVRAAAPGLYEVFTGKAVLYTTPTADFLIQGTLYDTRTQKDLTSLRIDAENSIDFATLPLDRAIRIVKGSGARTLAVFTDPDCPYCKILEESLQSVSNTTVYVFLMPLKRHPKAEEHARNIWCSGDRAKAWSVWMAKREEPPEGRCSDDPIAETSQLARKLNVSDTPTLYFANGHRTSGAQSPQELEKLLAANASIATAATLANRSCSATPGAGTDVLSSCTKPTDAD